MPLTPAAGRPTPLRYASPHKLNSITPTAASDTLRPKRSPATVQRQPNTISATQPDPELQGHPLSAL